MTFKVYWVTLTNIEQIVNVLTKIKNDINLVSAHTAEEHLEVCRVSHQTG